ncbi:MAG: hypothetical protein NW224_22320 [Leptolyngbyaceae cyanobacterium bins.302]|nr:hypothetical protein [Leptolyngbyaceae cyanobacterium bins.302]
MFYAKVLIERSLGLGWGKLVFLYTQYSPLGKKITIAKRQFHPAIVLSPIPTPQPQLLL